MSQYCHKLRSIYDHFVYYWRFKHPIRLNLWKHWENWRNTETGILKLERSHTRVDTSRAVGRLTVFEAAHKNKRHLRETDWSSSFRFQFFPLRPGSGSDLNFARAILALPIFSTGRFRSLSPIPIWKSDRDRKIGSSDLGSERPRLYNTHQQ